MTSNKKVPAKKQTSNKNKMKSLSIERSSEANNIKHLVITRFKELKYKKGRIVSFALCLGIVLIINLGMLGAFIPGTGKATALGVEIANGVMMVILAISLSASIFGREMQQNVTSLELREGYSPKELFMSRLIELLIECAVFMLSIVIVNVLIIAIGNKIGDGIWYQFYLSALGWYAIVLVITLGIAIFFCSFGGIIASTIVGLIVPFILVIFASLGGIIFGSNPMTSLGKTSREGSEMISDVYASRYSYIQNDIFEDKKENNKSWKELEPDSMNNLAQDIHKSFFVNDNNNSANYSKLAYYLSFGPAAFNNKDQVKELTGNEKIADFIYDVDSYFKSFNLKVNYGDIDFFSNPKYAYEYSNQAEIPENEPLTKIVNKMVSDKNLNKKYSSILETVKMFSDQRVLDVFSLYDGMNSNKFKNTWTAPKGWGPSQDNNNGGWSYDRPKVITGAWKDTINEIEHREKINAAEIIFFKNFFLSYDSQRVSDADKNQDNFSNFVYADADEKKFTVDIKNAEYVANDDNYGGEDNGKITFEVSLENSEDEYAKENLPMALEAKAITVIDKTRGTQETLRAQPDYYSTDGYEVRLSKLNIKKNDSVTLEINGNFNDYMYTSSEPAIVDTEDAPSSSAVASTTLINAFFNPFVQFTLMFFGVNYNNPYINNVADSQTRLGISNFLIAKEKISKDGTITFQRAIYPEALYLVFTLINALLVWWGYAIFKKKIVL